MGSWEEDIDGLVQDCSNSIANALELLQTCAKLSTCTSLSYIGKIVAAVDLVLGLAKASADIKHCWKILWTTQWVEITEVTGTGFYTKGCPLVKSNLISPSDKLSWQPGCPVNLISPSDKLSWQPGCPVLNINIQGNFCISQGNGSSDNLSENLV